MAGMDWFRWHHGSVTDPKFQLVAKKSGASVAEVIGVWAMLLEAASMNAERGNHGSLDFEALDCALVLECGKTQEIYTLMTARGLVDAQTKSITAWSKRQPKSEDETANERKRRQREREHELQVVQAVTHKYSRSVTDGHAMSRGVTPEEIRLEEIREEKGGSASASAGEPASPPTAIAAPPPIFSDQYRGVIKTERPELDAELVFSNFCGHYPEPKRTLSRWKKWVMEEHRAPDGAALLSVTVPPKAGIDPALAKCIADSLKCTGPPPEIRERMRQIASEGVRK